VKGCFRQHLVDNFRVFLELRYGPGYVRALLWLLHGLHTSYLPTKDINRFDFAIDVRDYIRLRELPLTVRQFVEVLQVHLRLNG